MISRPGPGTASAIAWSWVDAVSAGNVTAALELTAENFVYTAGSLYRYVGHQGMLDMFEDLDRTGGRVTHVILKAIEGDGVVALHRLETLSTAFGTDNIPSVSFAEVADGRLVRWTDYKNVSRVSRLAER